MRSQTKRLPDTIVHSWGKIVLALIRRGRHGKGQVVQQGTTAVLQLVDLHTSQEILHLSFNDDTKDWYLNISLALS